MHIATNKITFKEIKYYVKQYKSTKTNECEIESEIPNVKCEKVIFQGGWFAYG